MPVIKVRDKKVDVDIENELRAFDWHKAKWTDDKLIASSPFRPDDAPSFFVSLTGEYAGAFGDSGAIDGVYQSGGFVKLMTLLRRIDYDEAADYLIDKYGALYEAKDESDYVRIEMPRLYEQPTDAETYEPGDGLVGAISPYLTRRGIGEDVQIRFGVGYGEGHHGYTALPWHTVDGRIANVKYRSTSGKDFFYEKDATPVKRLVYALDEARKHDAVVIAEGEIDALSWWTAGVPAVALGTAHINDYQVEQIVREGFATVYAGGDNDKQGRKLNDMIRRKIGSFVEVRSVDYGDKKDANDVLKGRGASGLTRIIERSETRRVISPPRPG